MSERFEKTLYPNTRKRLLWEKEQSKHRKDVLNKEISTKMKRFNRKITNQNGKIEIRTKGQETENSIYK